VCISDDLRSSSLSVGAVDHLVQVNGIVVNDGRTYAILVCSLRGRCWDDPFRESSSAMNVTLPPAQTVTYAYQFGSFSVTKILYSWDQNAGQLNWNYTLKNSASTTQTWTNFPDLWENQTITSAPFWNWYGPYTAFSCSGSTTLNPTQTSTITCTFHPFNPNPPPYPFPALVGVAMTNANCQPNLCGPTWVIES